MKTKTFHDRIAAINRELVESIRRIGANNGHPSVEFGEELDRRTKVVCYDLRFDPHKELPDNGYISKVNFQDNGIVLHIEVPVNGTEIIMEGWDALTALHVETLDNLRENILWALENPSQKQPE